MIIWDEGLKVTLMRYTNWVSLTLDDFFNYVTKYDNPD